MELQGKFTTLQNFLESMQCVTTCISMHFLKLTNVSTQSPKKQPANISLDISAQGGHIITMQGLHWDTEVTLS